MNKKIIFTEPVLKETMWGGRRLEEFGYNMPSGKRFGECWAISAHKNGDVIVKSPSLSMMRLSELWKARRDLFGSLSGDRFPLLTKIIDAADDLSIQVHPDNIYAKIHENGSLGKTECWYVLDAKPDSKIVIGHNAKNHAEVEEMIKQKRWSDFIREVPVHKGDFFYIEPGTVHAIKSGTLILETQQNSDITYRVYDYDRLSNGKHRQLHIKQSIDVIKAPFVPSEPPKNPAKTVNKNIEELVSCSMFSVWHLDVGHLSEETVEQDQKFMLVSVVEGNGSVDGCPIKKGAHFILPFGYGKAHFSGQMSIVLSAPA